MAADSRISQRNADWTLCYTDDVAKVHGFRGTDIGVSYWGLPILDQLLIVESQLTKGENINGVSEKLREHFEKIKPKISGTMGIHVAGYVDGLPRLRHVFHQSWHRLGEFTNEDCHSEYHLQYGALSGSKVSYRESKEYPVLFNGDNLVANALFNYSSTLQPYYAIITHRLKLEDCTNLAKFIIGTSIQRLDYYFDLGTRQSLSSDTKTVGGPIYVATITRENGFVLAKYNPNTLTTL